MLRRTAFAFLVACLVGCGNDQPVSPTSATHQVEPGWEKGKPPPDDGPREIAFLESVKIKGSPSGNRTWCIRAMAVDGGNLATIHCPGPGVLPSYVTWEPDGTAIAYNIGTTTKHGFWRVDVDGTNEMQLLPCDPGICSNPRWSPDGQEIAIVVDFDPSLGSAVLLVPASGCQGGPCPRVLYSQAEGGAIGGVAWSPDGSQLATKIRGSGSGDVGQIVLIDYATGGTTDVADFDGSVRDWGRGTRATTLALSMFREGTNWQDLYLFDLSTPGVPPQMVVEGGRFPSFSPDGNFIVFQDLGESTAGGITTLDLDTGATTLLHNGNNPNFPDWRKPGPS